MAAFLLDLGAALAAESLKLRRTLALRLAFLAPLLIVFLESLLFYQRGEKLVTSGTDMWSLFTKNNLVLWGLLMAPLFVTLQTALLADLEHRHRNWEHLLALPLSRVAIYGAKQAMALALIGLSTPVIWVGIMLAGLGLRMLRPGIGFEAPVPLWPILRFALLSYFCSWLIIALHTWIAIRWPGFVKALGVGVAATVVGVVVVQSEHALYYPWTLPAAVTRAAILDGRLHYAAMVVGSVGGALIATLGCLDFRRRDLL
jgi:hypothetical protein